MSGMIGRAVSDGGALAGDARLDLRSWRVQVCALGAVVACITAVALTTLTSATAPNAHTRSVRPGFKDRTGTLMPISLASAASGAIGDAQRSFWAVRRGESLAARGGGIRSTFTASGASLRGAQGSVTLSLASVGRGRSLHPITPVAPTSAANRVVYRHGVLTESYRNGPYGLEQGFTVPRRPQGSAGSLVLALRVRGSLIPDQVGSQVLFRTRSGVVAVRYGQLSAVDATGRRLPARLRVGSGFLQLLIDDSNARYPVRVDPFIQQGEKLTGSGDVEANFGLSVALSADGDTALIGGPLNGGSGDHRGAAWVFTRSGETWTQQGEKLTGSEEIGNGSFFGWSVALSANGNTALIGGEADNEGRGAAWVFTRSGETWTQQGNKLTGRGEGENPGHFGDSVALSADGNTALIGGSDDSEGVGAAWVFTRAGETWTQQGEKLTGKREIGPYGKFGSAVALSSDGNTALIGGSHDNEGAGAVWVFTRSGATWMQQGEKLTGSGEINGRYGGEFGVSVALSGDGDTALIGGSDDNEEVGAAWVFTRSGETWTQQGNKLTGSGEVERGYFGVSVALSANGNTALIGGSRDTDWAGAAWLFTRSSETWTQQGNKLTGSGEVGTESDFGYSVALSAEGNTALIGGYGDAPAEHCGGCSAGAAWVFVQTARPTVLTGPATLIGQTSVTLKASVNPNGETVSDCRFEYGTTASYVKRKPCSSLPGSGESPVGVSARLGRLSANTTYHYRIVATNEGGTDYGNDRTFKTLPYPPAVTSISPDAGLESGGTSVTITGTEMAETIAVKFGSVKATSFTG